MGFHEGLTRAALISLWLVLLWLMFNKLWFGCDCISATLLLSAFPPLKISFRCLLHMWVLTRTRLWSASAFLFIFLIYIRSQHAGLVFIPAECSRGERILPGMEPVLCQRLHLWVERAPCWTSVSGSLCKHEISSSDGTHQILLISTFSFMPPPPWWHVFQPWPHSDNAIWSVGCNDKSQLLHWLDLYRIDINVHWFVTLIPLNSVKAGEDRKQLPMSWRTHYFRRQSFHIVAKIHSKKGNIEASIQLNLVFHKQTLGLQILLLFIKLFSFTMI